MARPHHGAYARDGGVQDDGFPAVNWKRWMEVNPDVVGWITVPGTGIDLPIVQAHAEDPCFYLTHDVYGEPNFTGCPYLDAACAETGGLLGCRNSVVFGHNMGWSRDMFADLDQFADPSFAAGHREVLIQTPESKSRLRVQAADVIPGWESAKRTDFDTQADFDSWWTERFEAADVRLADGPPRHHALLTLCTCSYNRWQDERTLVYCMAC
jgi:sortase B